jgi:hypothetical protein
MAERDPKTERLRVEIYRRMTPQQRIEIAFEMIHEATEMVRASIRLRQPDISEDDLEFEVRRRVLPPGMAELSEPARREYIRSRKS